MGIFCKGSAIVLFILNFIGSIVLGNTLAIPGNYSFSDPSFNWTMFLCGIIAGFILCLILYALGEILDRLEASKNDTYELYELLEKIVPKDEKKTEAKSSYSAPSASTVKRTSNGNWICKKCNAQNESNAQYCKDCGEYR